MCVCVCVWGGQSHAFSPLILQGFVVAMLYCFINGEVRRRQPVGPCALRSQSHRVCFQVQHELKRRWRRWMLSRDLASRPRRRHSFVSHSGCPHTHVSLLPYTPGSPATIEPARDTVNMWLNSSTHYQCKVLVKIQLKCLFTVMFRWQSPILVWSPCLYLCTYSCGWNLYLIFITTSVIFE